MRKAVMVILCILMAVTLGIAQDQAIPANPNQSQPTANSAQTATPAGTSNVTQPASQSPGQSPMNESNSSSGFGQPPVGGSEVPANIEMRATLDTPLSSKTSQPGDRFTATISQPVSGSNGVVVPAGTRVEGEVSETEQDKATAFRGKGKLNLRFRDIVLPNGQTVPLVATLVSVNTTNGRSLQKVDNENRIESGTQGRAVAQDMGAGANAGAPGSLTFGGPLKGLAIGTLAGGGYVLARNAKNVNLPAQTGMVIRLDQPLSVQ